MNKLLEYIFLNDCMKIVYNFVTKSCGYFPEENTLSSLEILNFHTNQSIIIENLLIDKHSNTIEINDISNYVVEIKIFDIVKLISDYFNWNLDNNIIVATSETINYNMSFGMIYYPVINKNNMVDICVFENGSYTPIQKTATKVKYFFNVLLDENNKLNIKKLDQNDTIDKLDNINSSHNLIKST